MILTYLKAIPDFRIKNSNKIIKKFYMLYALK